MTQMSKEVYVVMAYNRFLHNEVTDCVFSTETDATAYSRALQKQLDKVGEGFNVKVEKFVVDEALLGRKPGETADAE